MVNQIKEMEKAKQESAAAAMLAASKNNGVNSGNSFGQLPCLGNNLPASLQGSNLSKGMNTGMTSQNQFIQSLSE